VLRPLVARDRPGHRARRLCPFPLSPSLLLQQEETESREQQQQQRSRPKSNRKSPALDERACRTGSVELACRRCAGLGRSQGDTAGERLQTARALLASCAGWLQLLLDRSLDACVRPHATSRSAGRLQSTNLCFGVPLLNRRSRQQKIPVGMAAQPQQGPGRFQMPQPAMQRRC
jgi:hypothetical protein